MKIPMVKAETSPRSLYYLYLLPALAGIVLAAAGYAPTRSWAGPGGPKAMIAAQGVVLAVIYGTLLPTLRRMTVLTGSARLRAGLAAGAIRFLLTLAIGAAIAWRGSVDAPIFLLWLGITYAVMIKLETWAFISWAKKLDKRI